jgi:IS5 family transposase
VQKKKNTRRSPKCQRSPKNKKKRPYRIRNWKEYNASLVQRGSLTVWMEQAVLDNWINQEHSGQRGASHTYSDMAILTALTLKAVFRLPLRATQGLLTSVLRLLHMEHLPVPDYSTLCRRQKTLEVALPRRQGQASGQALHIVVDSTGCKIYGEGEWKVRQHGISKRRTWRKLHVAVDEATGQIVGAVLTTNDVADSAVLPHLLEQVEEPIQQLSGDGSYDQRPCYDTLRERQQEQAAPLRVTIPPRQGARIWQHGNSQEERLARDENLRRIRQVGRKQWKEESGYHRRSLAETTMFRAKTIFGDKLSARSFDSQAREAFIRCAALNTMTGLGMPESYAL